MDIIQSLESIATSLSVVGQFGEFIIWLWSLLGEFTYNLIMIFIFFFTIIYYIITKFYLILIVGESIILCIGIITTGFMEKLIIVIKLNYFLIQIPLLAIRRLISLFWGNDTEQ